MTQRKATTQCSAGRCSELQVRFDSLDMPLILQFRAIFISCELLVFRFMITLLDGRGFVEGVEFFVQGGGAIRCN